MWHIGQRLWYITLFYFNMLTHHLFLLSALSLQVSQRLCQLSLQLGQGRLLLGAHVRLDLNLVKRLLPHQLLLLTRWRSTVQLRADLRYDACALFITAWCLIQNKSHIKTWLLDDHVGDALVVGSHVVGCGFPPRPGHPKDHRKDSTNCLQTV